MASPFPIVRSVILYYTHRGIDGLPCDDMGCHLILLHSSIGSISWRSSTTLLHTTRVVLACFRVDSRKEGEML